MKKWVIGCLVLGMAVSGCDRAAGWFDAFSGDAKKVEAKAPEKAAVPWQGNEAYKEPLNLRTRNRACPEWKGYDVSPDAYDMPAFLERSKTGTFSDYIHIDCVILMYSPHDIDVWAEKGDVVATYAMLVRRYQDVGDACEHRAFLEAKLQSLGQAKVMHPALGRSISRLPDAFVSAAVLRRVCRVDGAEAFFDQAKAAGLTPSQIL